MRLLVPTKLLSFFTNHHLKINYKVIDVSTVAGISYINGSLLSVSNDLSTQQIQVNCYTFRIGPNQVTWRIDSSYQEVNVSEWINQAGNGSQLLDSVDQIYRHYITLNGSFSVGMSISCNTIVNRTTSGLTYELEG